MSGAQSTFAIFIAAILLQTPSARADESSDVSGKWTLVLKSDAGVQRSQLDLQQHESELIGRYTDEFGTAEALGTIEDDELNLRMRVEIPEEEDLIVTITGTVRSETIEGSVQYGGLGTAAFTAERQ